MLNDTRLFVSRVPLSPFQRSLAFHRNQLDLSFESKLGMDGFHFFNFARLLEQLGAEFLECDKERVRLDKRRLWIQDDPKRPLKLAALATRAAKQGVTVSVYARYQSNERAVTSFYTQAAEVEVDPETGKIRVRKFVSAVDWGTILNLLTYQSQVEGGFTTGLGYALMEEMPVDEGRVGTLHFGDYKIPTTNDIPRHGSLYNQEPSGPTPYQGNSIGETTNPPVAAAIANATADAAGIRITGLPLTAEIFRQSIQSLR